MRAILHVDMDAFFASVEQRDDPSLRGKPVVVGSSSRRGVVAAASYEARPYGVRSAMPMAQALDRCPHAVIVPPNRARYVEASRQVFDVFRAFTPLVEGRSLDEAFLDVTGSQKLFGDAVSIAEQIRARIRERTELTASAGVAPNKFIAKIASDLQKPDGLTVVAKEGAAAFLAPLSVRKMWGVGPRSAERLETLGFHTLGDLARADPRRLEQIIGAFGARAHHLARGIDDRPVVPGREAKSIGAERTFERDYRDARALEPAILAQAEEVAHRLLRAGLWAGTVTLKIKYGNHQQVTRQTRLEPPAADTETLYRACLGLLEKVPDLRRGVRLTGVSASGFRAQAAPTLFDGPDAERREALDRAQLALQEKFGSSALKRARLMSKDRPETLAGALSNHAERPEEIAPGATNDPQVGGAGVSNTEKASR